METGTRRIMDAVNEQEGVRSSAGRILVLEDEETVARAIARMLAGLGYACELTADGRDTVRRYLEARNEGRAFLAVIMDLEIRGGMGGADTVRVLRAAAPEARVLVSSGAEQEPAMRDYAAYGFDAALPKPYGYRQLGEVLAGLLGGVGAGGLEDGGGRAA